jgi:hypothetical protein
VKKIWLVRAALAAASAVALLLAGGGTIHPPF